MYYLRENIKIVKKDVKIHIIMDNSQIHQQYNFSAEVSFGFFVHFLSLYSHMLNHIKNEFLKIKIIYV